jgi:GAF domain-containing protein
MSLQSSAHALAEVTAALVREHDVTDLLTVVLRDCIEVLPVDGAAILVLRPGGALELLSASSHRMEELELYQAQNDEGPCVDVAHSGQPVMAQLDEVQRRWPAFAKVMSASGYSSVHAFPLRWRGGPMGGLNLFSRAQRLLDAAEREIAQNFADLAALAVLRPIEPRSEATVERSVSAALEGRVVVEQAKGVLAHRLGFEMSDAYDELVRRARDAGTDVTTAARELVDRVSS